MSQKPGERVNGSGGGGEQEGHDSCACENVEAGKNVRDGREPEMDTRDQRRVWGGGRVIRVDGAVVGTDMKKRPSLVQPFLSKTRGENRNRMVKGKIAVLFACGNVDATFSINAGRPHGAFLHMMRRARSPVSSYELAPSPHECQHTTRA